MKSLMVGYDTPVTVAAMVVLSIFLAAFLLIVALL